ncbi:MAG: hypothetical protein FWG06_02195, partial [Clostridiales bacterium]|nr:hypothetical protein [Clostridiales bacterium]
AYATWEIANAAYEEWVAAGSTDEPVLGPGPMPEEPKDPWDEEGFKLSEADWQWVADYNDFTIRNTRYVNFTSWAAAVGEWSHSGEYIYKGRRIPRSTQGENDGMATFAHEFGHISSIADSYGNPWVDRVSPATEPWELMSRGSFAGPYGDHARWTVPGVEAGSIPTHLMLFNKNKLLNFYDEGDLLEIDVWDLAESTPVVADIVARNIPLGDDAYYPWLKGYGLTQDKFIKGIVLNFAVTKSTNISRIPIRGDGEWADKASYSGTQMDINTGVITKVNPGFTNYRKEAAGYTVEVVDQSGYDSFLNDHGVLLGRFHANQGNPSHAVVDSHLGDIAMMDFELNGEYTPYPMAHAAQLADATFHAGTSTTNTGYYATIYDPEGKYYGREEPIYYDDDFTQVWKKDILEPGSLEKDEPQEGRKIVSGNTVNEYYDSANGLHYYILDRHDNPGKVGTFLSYSIGLRHNDGQPVGGALAVQLLGVESDIPGKVSVATYGVTNTGDATDIVRVTTEGTLLNNLYAIGAGETIEVPVYIEVADDAFAGNWKALAVSTTVSSESNSGKTASATVYGDEFVLEKVDNVTVSASVKKQNGNKNDLTITLTEYWNSGRVEVYTKTFSIANNAADKYSVGGYTVYVDTKGNDQIRECYVIK